HAVTAAHESQDAVGAALQTQVQVRTDARRPGEGGYEVAAHLGRFETAQAHAEVAGQPVEPVEQMPQPAPCFPGLAAAEIQAVVAEVDARQDDLLAAARDERLDFRGNLVR